MSTLAFFFIISPDPISVAVVGLQSQFKFKSSSTLSAERSELHSKDDRRCRHSSASWVVGAASTSEAGFHCGVLCSSGDRIESRVNCICVASSGSCSGFGARAHFVTWANDLLRWPMDDPSVVDLS